MEEAPTRADLVEHWDEALEDVAGLAWPHPQRAELDQLVEHDGSTCDREDAEKALTDAFPSRDKLIVRPHRSRDFERAELLYVASQRTQEERIQRVQTAGPRCDPTTALDHVVVA